MKLRVVVCLLAFISFYGVAAHAQEGSKVDVFAGYSYVRDNPSTPGASGFSLNGGTASVSYHVNGWLSGVADFGGYHNGNILGTNIDGTLSTYLFGPRVSYRRYGKITPFAQVLFGVAHASGSLSGSTATIVSSDNAFAMTVGGGVDYKLSHRFAIRPLQVEYLLTRFSETGNGSQSQNNLRVSTGVVFHF
jgi:opacity protein-like surface antigen